MSNHPNRGRPKPCLFCDGQVPIYYDKHGTRYHVLTHLREVAPCRAIRNRKNEGAQNEQHT